MQSRSIDVQIFTLTHRIFGDVFPGAPGLFSYLNRPTESYLEVEDVRLNLLHKIAEPPERCTRLWLVKREIVAVLVSTRAGLGPSSGMRSGYTKPFPHLVRILVGGYELRGQLQSGARLDFGALMVEGENVFLPLFEGRLTALLFPRAQAEAPAMAFNRALVNALSLLPREEREL
ncbi:MAG: hypothetical protein GTO14_13240 [Anaerolineales bacterium]|nr:hypothetical protein [Anaerolineales bacterium]